MASYLNEEQTIGTDASNVLPDRTALNQKRLSLIITNTSIAAQKITIAVDKEATNGAGIVLYPGGSWSEPSGLNVPPQKKISAISNLAGGTLSVYEEVQ